MNTLGKLMVPSRVLVFGFATVILLGALLLALPRASQDGLGLPFSSSLSTVGLSVGVTLPTTPPVVLWTEIVGMLFGRLEIYVILIAVIKFFKDARSMVVTKK